MSNQNFYECQVVVSLKKVPLISRKGVYKTGKTNFFETDVWFLTENLPLISERTFQKNFPSIPNFQVKILLYLVEGYDHTCATASDTKFFQAGGTCFARKSAFD